MTQEELDALMNQDLDADNFQMEEEAAESEKFDDSDFRVDSGTRWPPPPPTSEHKVVHQLDEVTRDSEVKSSQIFDILETISNDATNIETMAGQIKSHLEGTLNTLEKLRSSFPNIKTFITEETNCRSSLEMLDRIIETTQNDNDQTMVAMDVLQYQDIHRQKIERVINVMRALARYMNSLFEGQISDEKRVSSAVHIQGDATSDVVDEEDIEALIAAFGQKK